MGNFEKVGTTGEFSDGSKKKVIIKGQEILLARVGTNYYAVGNRCTHMNGDLSQGTLEGVVITCPRHASQFDIRDGKNLRWMKGSGMLSSIGKALKSPQPLPAYKVKIENGDIFVEI